MSTPRDTASSPRRRALAIGGALAALAALPLGIGAASGGCQETIETDLRGPLTFEVSLASGETGDRKSVV